MKKSKLIEMITREIERQAGGSLSEIVSGRGNNYTIYYEFYDIVDFDGRVRTSKARFAPGQQGCQDFYDWWTEEFMNVTNFDNLEEFGDIVYRASNGVMACPDPFGAFAIAIPAKLAMQMEAPTSSIIGGDGGYYDIIARMAGVSTDEIEVVHVRSASQRFA
jgi:hypothetical protein